MAPATAVVVRRRAVPRVGASRTTAQRRWVGRAPPNLVRVIRLDAATVLLQWATGGLLFIWVTTRHREVGLGYGWLLRGVYLVMAAGALACGAVLRASCRCGTPLRPAWSLATLGRAGGVAGCRKGAGVSRAAGRARPPHGPGRGHDRHRPLDRRRGGGRRTPARRRGAAIACGSSRPASTWWRRSSAPSGWSPRAWHAGGQHLAGRGPHAGRRRLPRRRSPTPCSSATGTSCSPACPGGCSTSWSAAAMLRLAGRGRPPAAAARAWSSVLNGTIDDGWDGMLGWFWVACAVTTLVLLFVTRAALRER